MQAGSEKRMEPTEALREGTWQVAMWMRCCAACNGYLERSGRAITFAANADGNGNGNANIIEYCVSRNSVNRAENGFRPSSAERSSCFRYWKRSQHDVQMQRLKHAPDKLQRFESRFGNC